MAYLSLYRKWRPQSFDEIAGQSHITQTLKNAVDRGRVAHAYLFCGPRGTGKTSTARILAKAINCDSGPSSSPCNKCESCMSISDGRSIDVLELDAASNRGVDEIRELLRRIPYSSSHGRKKVYIIDEVHMLTAESFNTLLKTLEEPPDHVIFVLATTEPHKVLPTILSRCQRFDFRRISLPDIALRLEEVAESEGISVDLSALSLIADHAQGALRDALGVLDQLSSYSEERITSADVISLLGLTDGEILLNFTDILMSYDLAEGLLFVDGLIEKGFDLRQFIQDILKHLRNLFLLQTVPDMKISGVPEELKERYSEQAVNINPRSLAFFVNVLNEVYNQSRWATDIRLLFEIALFKMMKFSDDVSIESILHRVERLEDALLNGVSLSRTEKKQVAEPNTKAGIKTADAVSSHAPSAKTAKETPAGGQVLVDKDSGVNAIPGAIGAHVNQGRAMAIDLEALKKIWPQVLKIIKQKKPSRYGFFESAKLNRIEDGKIVLSIKDSARAFVESPEGLGLLQNALKVASGNDFPVICELSKGEAKTVAVTDSDFAEGLLPVDDYIKLVQDTFGAKIIEDISIDET